MLLFEDITYVKAMSTPESPDPPEAPSEAAGAAVLNVLVIGFHLKKGCQVEYSSPPLMPGGDSRSSELPSQWRHLPALAMPDGSHNFLSDTAFFHLPALDNPRKTVFGISCYRQIDADKVCMIYHLTRVLPKTKVALSVPIKDYYRGPRLQ